mmetsp:Transcript_20190/g.60005  ORF Transcript_20190/g.60005 Transcript_20190/m.60005 type:complete len:372 (+) Transcript_20190:87-1202(+)
MGVGATADTRFRGPPPRESSAPDAALSGGRIRAGRPRRQVRGGWAWQPEGDASRGRPPSWPVGPPLSVCLATARQPQRGHRSMVGWSDGRTCGSDLAGGDGALVLELLHRHLARLEQRRVALLLPLEQPRAQPRRREQADDHADDDARAAAAAAAAAGHGAGGDGSVGKGASHGVGYSYEQLTKCGKLFEGRRIRGGLGLRLLYTRDRRLPRDLLRQYARVVDEVLPNMPQERLLHDDQNVGNYHLLLSHRADGRIVAGITFRVIRSARAKGPSNQLLFDALLAVVASDAQGSGYGSLLVDQVKRIATKQAAARGAEAVLLTQADDGAFGFWGKHGLKSAVEARAHVDALCEWRCDENPHYDGSTPMCIRL